MAVRGIPTTAARGGRKDMNEILREFDAILINLNSMASQNRAAMIAGDVGDDVIANVWLSLAQAKKRIEEIRKMPDFQDEYARFMGLAYTFDCSDDVNAATDVIRNLPDNHPFVKNDPVDFLLIDGALTGGLSVGVNYFVRTVDVNTITLTDALDGISDINLSNAVGSAQMIVNIKPNLAALRSGIDVALTQIQENLAQRAYGYDQPNVDFTYSTRSTLDTGTLQDDLLDIVNLIDTAA